MNLLNQTFMYVQQAPEPVHASFVSPDILASNTIQLNAEGKAFKMAKSINNVRKALKLVVLIFLLSESKNFNPLYSILKYNKPKKPRIKGKKILKFPGREPLMFILKKEFKKTSNILIDNKTLPI
tara:strand:+ start:376 stop:750 length:375 start_codon:yes stop_codon:yes gene_type:complete